MDSMYPLPEADYGVLVRCFCFNQEKYIEQTLKGFVLQKTSFPFIALIVDDCSSDGTQAIIRKYENEYPDIIKGLYLKENHFSQKKTKMPYVNPWRDRCKYEAVCEGDDYWVDPLKLQKQYDFLESHPEYCMVYTNIDVFDQQKGVFFRNYFTDYYKVPSSIREQLVQGGFWAPCSWMMRMDVARKPLPFASSDGSFVRLLEMLLRYKIGYIDDVTAVYRKIDESASHSKSCKRLYQYGKGVYKIKQWYMEKYPELIGPADRDKVDLLFVENYVHHMVYYRDSEMLKIIKSNKNLKIPVRKKIWMLLPNFIAKPIIFILHKRKGEAF